MSVLVIAEHDNASLKGATLNAVTAAKAIDADVHVLVAGASADAALIGGPPPPDSLTSGSAARYAASAMVSSCTDLSK